MLKPLEQWFCDTCGELIQKPDDGWLEWLREDHPDQPGKIVLHSFRLVHHMSASPRRQRDHRPGDPVDRHASCYQHEFARGRSDGHLKWYLGPNSIAQLLSIADDRPPLLPFENQRSFRDPGEWLEIVRRLAIPHYEEARLYFRYAEEHGDLDGRDASNVYNQDFLLELIRRFASQRRVQSGPRLLE